MKTLPHRIGLSLLAMSGGWIACNLAWWLLFAAHEEWADFSSYFLFIGSYSGIVIFIAWLIIFLPVDLLIPLDSSLRRPGPAALCGFLAVIIPTTLVCLRILIEQTLTHGWLEAARQFSTVRERLHDFIALGACITGTCAAWLRSLLSPANPATDLKKGGLSLLYVVIYNTSCLVLLTSAGPFVDQKQTREYWMTWDIKSESAIPATETEVVLSFVDFPCHYIGEYSNALANHLRQIGDRKVKAVFEVTSDFGKLRGFRSLEIAGLKGWKSEGGYTGSTHLNGSTSASPWE